MFAKGRWRHVMVILAVACVLPRLSAEIIEFREYRGKQVGCGHSGLVGVARACGTEWYARVFTGIVRSSVDIGDTDKRLEIIPDGVFLGDSSDATAITNQACLKHDILVGDRWLFYLSREPKSDVLVLSYDSPSKPISEAEDDISMLRNLGQLKNAGILIGTIYRLGDTEDADSVPLANHKLVAKNVRNQTEYTTYTNEKGYFKFELPVGTYSVTTAHEYGLREVESFSSMKGSIPVENGRCWEHDFAVKPIAAIKPKTDGIISGHVGSPDGKPFSVHPWVQIVSVDSKIFTSAYVDARGYFNATGVKPGRYVVGIGIEPGTGGPDVKTPIYYPGVRTKNEATIIELRPREKRTNVDFQLPPEDVIQPLGSGQSNR